MAAQNTIPTASDARAYYAAQPATLRGALARELASEVLDHYAHATTLVGLLLAEIRTANLEDQTALRLANVADAWLNDREHVAQEARLNACLSSLDDK